MKSLKKALDILELVAEANGIGVRELSAKTGFPPPTVHRIMKALAEQGYLRQNPDTKTYLLSTRFLYYSDRVQQQFDLIPIARPHLEQLSADTEASVNLCVLDNLVVVYIDHVHSQKHTLRTFTRLGAREPAYATGVGKVFLSQMKPDELRAYLAQVKIKQFTKNTITDHKTMAREIERVKKQGYAVDQQERENGVRCIAAPICNHKGSIVAAVSISGATQFITFKRVKPLSGLIRNTAARISAELGYKHSRSV